MVAQLPEFSPVYAQRGSDGHHCLGPPKLTAGYGDPAPCRYLDHGRVAAVPCPDLHPLGHDLPYGCMAVAPPHGYGAHGVTHGSLHGYGVTGRDNHGAFSDHHGPPSHIHRHTCGDYGCHDGSVCGTDGLCWSGLGLSFSVTGPTSSLLAPASPFTAPTSPFTALFTVPTSPFTAPISPLTASAVSVWIRFTAVPGSRVPITAPTALRDWRTVPVRPGFLPILF